MEVFSLILIPVLFSPGMSQISTIVQGIPEGAPSKENKDPDPPVASVQPPTVKLPERKQEPVPKVPSPQLSAKPIPAKCTFNVVHLLEKGATLRYGSTVNY